ALLITCVRVRESRLDQMTATVQAVDDYIAKHTLHGWVCSFSARSHFLLGSDQDMLDHCGRHQREQIRGARQCLPLLEAARIQLCLPTSAKLRRCFIIASAELSRVNCSPQAHGRGVGVTHLTHDNQQFACDYINFRQAASDSDKKSDSAS